MGESRKGNGREAQSWNFTIIKLEIISIIWSHNSSPFCGVMAPLENLMKVMELSSEKCARTQFQSIHGNPESHHSIPGKPLDFLLWIQAPGNQAYFMAPDSEGLLPRLAGGTHCTLALAGTSPEGQCFATWQCQSRAGSANASARIPRECCARPWGHSWRDGSSQACLSCSSRYLPGAPHLQPRCSPWREPWPSSGGSTSVPQPPVPPGWASTTEPLMGATTTSCATAPTCWQEPLTPPGLSTSHPGDIAPSLGTVSWGWTPGQAEHWRRRATDCLFHVMYPQGPGLSLRWQGDWLVLSGGLGVVVRLDRSSSVCIYMDHELQGHAQGLCGVYSGRPEDDFQEPGGRLAVLASTFGNSWTLPDSEVPPVGYQEACLCACCAGAPQGSGPEGRLEAVCTTLANYAQYCAKQHTHLLEEAWLLRAPVPGGQLYSDCVSACPPSCPAAGEVAEGPCREACVSGCGCTPGLLWDGALCVPAARCPCHHRRRRYTPGDTVRQLCNPCVCQDGRWLCAQAPCPAEWAVGGDGHYLTFGGRSFFRGLPGCRSSLVQVGNDWLQSPGPS